MLLLDSLEASRIRKGRRFADGTKIRKCRTGSLDILDAETIIIRLSIYIKEKTNRGSIQRS